MMNRKYWGKFSSISTALAAALSASCVGEVEPGVAVENIQGGSPPDVTVDAMGNVAIGDPRQWARDASVRMSGPTTLCSGTLVSPRVVLTNAHCVRRELPIGVHFSPLNPNGDRGIVVPGAREIVEAGIIRCEIHPERDGACGDGFTYGSPQENDLAVLVLDQRFDATPGSPYPVTPAHVVENDPGNIPGGWTFQQAWMAGYGQEGVFPDSGTNKMRLVATTHIASVSFREFLTAHMRGRAGDSGCGVFVFRNDDGSPLQLLGVNHAGDGSSSIAVRLTAPGMQRFLGDFLGPKDEHYPGAMVAVGDTEVWTGDADLPQRGDVARIGWRDPVTGETAAQADPDGDGLRGRHDNCWGIFNPRQELSDGSRTATCVSSMTLATVTYGCAARPTVFDGLREGSTDSDGDSIPDVCDNCPGAANSNQADCNADAVAEVNSRRDGSTEPLLPIVGDACDPTPCARTELVPETTTTGGSLVSRRVTRFDRIDVDGVAAAPRFNGATGFRFCRCEFATVDDAPSRQRCIGGRSDPFIQGCVLANPATYDRVTESVPWRFVSMTGTATTERPPLPLTSESSISYSVPSGNTFVRNWHSRFALHEFDIPRWVAAPLAGLVPERIPSGTLNGVLWTHTRGIAGGASFNAETRRISNHYLSGPFSPPVTSIPIIPRATELVVPFVRRWNWFGQRAFLVRGSFGTVIASGGGAVPPLTPAQATEFTNFASGDSWVAAAEPATLLQHTTVRYTALNTAGVQTMLGEVNGTFVSLDAPQCVPGQCSPSDNPGVIALSARAAPPWDPTSGVMTLSATREVLWLLRDATTTTRARLAAYDIATDSWQERDVPIASDILAATYAPGLDVLWVLDQIRVDGRLHARLLAVHPDSGFVTEAARWRRLTTHDRFALAAASDGSLYIASGRFGVHVVALVRPYFNAVTVVGVQLGLGGLPPYANVMVADDEGVSILSERPREYVTNDYEASSFVRGGVLGSCL